MDRNAGGSKVNKLVFASLSARRAWIEIPVAQTHVYAAGSLSARRAWIEIADVVSVQHGCESLSARRAWIEMQDQFLRFGPRDRRSPQGERG